MAQHLLNSTQIGTLLEKMCSERMTQGMRMDIRRKPIGHSDFLDDAAHAAGC